jgi:hypothetical protein
MYLPIILQPTYQPTSNLPNCLIFLFTYINSDVKLKNLSEIITFWKFLTLLCLGIVRTSPCAIRMPL